MHLKRQIFAGIAADSSLPVRYKINSNSLSVTSSKYKIWEPFLLSLAVILGMLAGARLVQSNNPSHASVSLSKTHYTGRQVEEIIRFLETKYVSDVSTDSLVTKAIDAILSGLDPHTHYFPPEQKDELDERTSGNYVGIGIEIAFIQDSLIVLYPKKDSPALRAGIHPGDYIIAIDGKTILGDSLNHMDILNRIKGTKGTNVKLTLKPMMADTQRIVEVTRDEIKVPSVPAAYMIDSTVAYIKIDRFMNATYREFMDAWELLNTKHHAQHLILDLRDNPGGYLKEAVNILSQFFPEEGKLLVYTEGKNQKRMDYKSTGKVFFPVDHLTVLINGNSASASEIVAGCIQDQDRGVIIGSRSYGKGLVQEQFDLSNGGILRMTVSRYYTPSGRLIQKAYDAASAIDTLRSYSTTMGRPEHAGGGIIPDIEIRDEVKWQNSIMSKWMDIISEYAIHYNLIQHHGEIISVSQIPKIEKSLPAKETILKDLIDLAGKRSNPAVLDSLKAIFQAQPDQLYRITQASMIAYRTGEEGWYMAYNENDPVVLKAREVVKADPRTLLKK